MGCHPAGPPFDLKGIFINKEIDISQIDGFEMGISRQKPESVKKK